MPIPENKKLAIYLDSAQLDVLIDAIERDYETVESMRVERLLKHFRHTAEVCGHDQCDLRHPK